VLITGASSGLGRCLAEGAARLGARLVLAARSADRLRETAEGLKALGAECVVAPADVTVAADRARLLRIAEERLGGLDVLINNAGVASFGHFADSSEAILRQIMEVNFFAPAELMRSALPLLRNGQQPAIVNVASMCGRRGMPAWTEYSASKFALCGLTEALRAEFARFDVDVLLVVQGLTRTEFGRHLLRNEGRLKIDFAAGMDPAAVATAILRSLVKNRAETVLGTEARWLLRVSRFFPGLMDRMIARKVRLLYARPVNTTLPRRQA
jgi:short-subunit dehydrogenase